MKRAACTLMVALLFLLISGASADRQTVQIYLVDPCGGCAAGTGCGQCAIEDEVFLRYRALLEGIDQADRPIRLHNLRRAPNEYTELEALLASLGIASFSLPILLVGDAVFSADGTQDAAIAAYLAGDTAAYEGYQPPAPRERAGVRDNDRSILYLSTDFCEDCKKVERFLARALPKDIVVRKYEIGTQEGMRMEQAVHAYYSLAEAEWAVPLIVYGDNVLVGWQQIAVALLSRIEEEPNAATPNDTSLLSALSTAPLPDSVMTYLYVQSCASCAQVKALLDALPGQLFVDDAQGRNGMSTVVIREVDGSDREAAHALFAAYGVPDAKQVVPSIFLSETYYAGVEDILADLESAIRGGEALPTVSAADPDPLARAE